MSQRAKQMSGSGRSCQTRCWFLVTFLVNGFGDVWWHNSADDGLRDNKRHKTRSDHGDDHMEMYGDDTNGAASVTIVSANQKL